MGDTLEENKLDRFMSWTVMDAVVLAIVIPLLTTRYAVSGIVWFMQQIYSIA